MGLSRRQFLKVSGVATIAGVTGGFGLDLQLARSGDVKLAIQSARSTTTICPFCAVGCGMIVYTDRKTGKVINVEGDPDHPINEGALCAKGSALYQVAVNPERLTHVRYRAPYSDRWELKSWNWALDRIAAKIKKTRDRSFVSTNRKGLTVNRTERIGHVGSAALDNEECWLLQGMMRAMGLVYIEHQARI
jgi:formate dehydrogenase major subunit